MAAAFLVSEMSGSGVLALPRALANTGEHWNTCWASVSVAREEENFLVECYDIVDGDSFLVFVIVIIVFFILLLTIIIMIMTMIPPPTSIPLVFVSLFLLSFLPPAKPSP